MLHAQTASAEQTNAKILQAQKPGVSESETRSMLLRWKNTTYSTQQEISNIFLPESETLYNDLLQQRRFGLLDELTSITLKKLRPWKAQLHTAWWTWHGLIAQSEDVRGNTSEALRIWAEVLDSLIAEPSPDSLFMGEVCLQMAKISYNTQEIEMGLAFAIRGIRFMEPSYGDTDMFASLLFNAGRLYRQQGEYVQALTFFRRAVDILETIPVGDIHPASITIFYVEIAQAYNNQGKSHLALQFYEKAVAVMAYPEVSYSDQMKICGNIAGLYRTLDLTQANGWVDSALSRYHLALAAGESVGIEEELVLLIRKGRIGYLSGKEKEARVMLEKIVRQAAQEQLSFPLLFGCNELVKLSIRQHNPLDALHWWQAGYRAWSGDYSLSFEAWDQDAGIGSLTPSVNLATYFLFRAEAFLLLHEQGQYPALPLLDRAEQATLASQSLLMAFRRTREERNQEFSEVYQDAQGMRLEVMMARKEKGHEEQMFQLMDRSKVLGIQEDWLFEQRKRGVPIPDQWKKRLGSLEQEVIELETGIFDAELGAKPGSEQEKEAYWKKAELVRVRRHLHQIEDSIKTQFPSFALADSLYPFVPVDQLRAKALPLSAALISFLYFEDHIYVSLLTHGAISVEKILLDKPTQQLLLQVISNIRNPHPPSSAAVQSLKMYQCLLKPFIDQLPASITQLMIVPDGPLVELPFEALVVELGTSAQRPQYLLDRFALSYWLSSRARLLLEDLEPQASSHQLAAFAPAYPTGGDQLAMLMEKDEFVGQLVREGNFDLPGARKEASVIADIWNGQAYQGTGITEEAFLKEAGNFSVLHLAMHALVEEEQAAFSRLLFAPSGSSARGFLSAMEIAALDLPADMVVLSACNTGRGEWKAGEGVFHLGRAFRKAGVRSLVMSLWQVPDEATSHLMPDFYRGLKEGLSKSEALRQAKLNYLDQADPALAEPYFWSGFVMVGDESPLPPPGNSWSWWWLVALPLILASLWFWRIRGKLPPK
ncbi:MAG: CHAT domain-containing protein [Bacteroidia bacterium]|nr:CHAT domain-containing protein [Bacteroidia bacterium]